ncbi:MAG: NlpC/P60 family protein [Desulfobacterota bacterium]|nr:NlpC/P60 family protein [Thermodesulfobacteriota bacterium]MDW8002295.1 NlpC/P60 family protein [Deltaproteobacteria bacterium]
MDEGSAKIVCYNLNVEPRYYVCVPFTDLLRRPSEPKIQNYFDRKRLTQLLYNEEVRIIRNEGEWCFVEAPEQLSFRQRRRWAPYRGWVKMNALRKTCGVNRVNAVVISSFTSVKGKTGPFYIPFGSRIFVRYMTDGSLFFLEEEGEGYLEPSKISLLNCEIRNERKAKDPVTLALTFVGCKYLWGGRSPSFLPTEKSIGLTGVDCSGLVNLVFRGVGIDIPRDAHEQFMKAKKIKGSELEKGDLIFVSSKERGKIDHVMIYCGDGFIVEASGKEGKVRYLSVKDGLPVDPKKVDNKLFHFKDTTFYFGRFVKENENKGDRDKKTEDTS